MLSLLLEGARRVCISVKYTNTSVPGFQPAFHAVYRMAKTRQGRRTVVRGILHPRRPVQHDYSFILLIADSNWVHETPWNLGCIAIPLGGQAAKI